MPRSSVNSSIDYALRADLLTHDVEYEHGEGEVHYEVHEDADAQYRAVVASAYRENGSRVDYEVLGVRLYPSWWERVKERLTSYEFEPPLEYELVHEATEQMEQAIDEVERAKSRHTICDLKGESE